MKFTARILYLPIFTGFLRLKARSYAQSRNRAAALKCYELAVSGKEKPLFTANSHP